MTGLRAISQAVLAGAQDLLQDLAEPSTGQNCPQCKAILRRHQPADYNPLALTLLDRPPAYYRCHDCGFTQEESEFQRQVGTDAD